MQATAPDFVDPIAGFRHWRLADGRLRSLYSGIPGCDPEMRASCVLGRRDCDNSPVSACSCGICADFEPCPRKVSACRCDFVAGAVILWGCIELHAMGMGAQYARGCTQVAGLPRSKEARAPPGGQRLNLPVVPPSSAC